MAISLLYTCMVTPFEVGMSDKAVTVNDPLFGVNRAVDAIFLADVLISFNLMCVPGAKPHPIAMRACNGEPCPCAQRVVPKIETWFRMWVEMGPGLGLAERTQRAA